METKPLTATDIIEVEKKVHAELDERWSAVSQSLRECFEEVLKKVLHDLERNYNESPKD